MISQATSCFRHLEPIDGARERAPLRILVAEDNLVSQRLVMRLLEEAGNVVVVAANGQEAMDAIEQQPFDLVLMDVQMPVMDGFELTARIRRREQGSDSHLPIVAVTSHAEWGDRERCLQVGMDGYVPKPVKADVLFAAIDAAIDCLTKRFDIPACPAGGPGTLKAGRRRGEMADAGALPEAEEFTAPRIGNPRIPPGRGIEPDQGIVGSA